MAGTEGGTRTPKPVRTVDFESTASTNSATSALMGSGKPESIAVRAAIANASDDQPKLPAVLDPVVPAVAPSENPGNG